MRALGLDLGTQSVKAVEIESSFGRYEIKEYHEREVNPGEKPVAAAGALVKELPRRPDKIAVFAPASQITYRNLALPMRDKKALQQAIAFELEDELPYPAEEAANDSVTLTQSSAGSKVHVASALRKNVEAFLATLAEQGIDPDLVTTEPWGLRALINRVIVGQDRPILALHIGHERTLMHVQWQGQPVHIRESAWGGRDLTTLISQKYSIPYDQAEEAKLNHGFVLAPSQASQATPDQAEFSSVVYEQISGLLLDIRQAELGSKSTTHQNISAIFLSGGTSLLPGLARLIEEELSIRTLPLRALSGIAKSGVTYSDSADAKLALAAAGAFALAMPEKCGNLNLRRGPLAKGGTTSEFDFAAIRKPLIGGATVSATLIASLLVQSSVYQSRIADIDTQLERSVKSFFGQIASSAVRNYMADTTSLKNAITKELDKQRELAKLSGPNKHSPLDFMKSVSSQVPPDVIVDLTLFQVGAAPDSPYRPEEPGSVNLSFLVASPQVADRLGTVLARAVQGIQRSSPEETTLKDGSKRWKVTFSGTPSEASFGR